MNRSQEEQGPASSIARKGAGAAWLVIDPSSVGGNDASSAGGDAADLVSAIEARLAEAFGDLRVVHAAGPGDAARAAREASLAGVQKLFVAGGDAAVTGVVNGLCAPDAVGRPDVGIIPLGEGADFARTLGIEGAPLDALEGLLGAEPRDVDLGVVNGRVFLNASAGGLSAEAPDAVCPELKTFAGRFAYALGGVRAYLDHESFTVRYRSGPGDKALQGRERILLFAVCNAPAPGGGRVVAPRSIADDGLLEICLVREAPPFEFTAILAKLADGAHVDDPRVVWLRAKRLELAFDRVTKVDADGEAFEARSVSYGVLPRALRVLAPRPRHSSQAFAQSA